MAIYVDLTQNFLAYKISVFLFLEKICPCLGTETPKFLLFEDQKKRTYFKDHKK